MIIVIKKDSLVRDVQNQFTGYFPFLKIEFLKGSLEGGVVFKKEYAIPGDFFKRIPSLKYEGEIYLDFKQAINELEKHFKEYYGVSIHIFRKAGNVWIETTLTNDWTLERQNKEAELMCRYFFK
jgi:hypothetical protein